MGVEGAVEDTGASTGSDQEGTVEEDTGATSNGSDQEQPSDLEAKIIRQIEYYFGDINLITDKFMRQQIKLDDGWIPLETMVKFNRLKNLATENDVIVNALKKSTNNLIEISEDGEKVRRNPDKPLPEEGATPFEEIKARSVYLKGFPQDSTLDQLIEFFKDKGKILKIHMRKKYNSKNFKGSIFATFGSKEETEEFMKIGILKFRNKELLKELSVDYHARKAKELQKRKEDREKKLQDRKQKAAATEDNDEETKDSKDENEDEIVNESIIDVKGSVLKLSGFAPKTCWEDIREVFQIHGEIAFVDFSRGQEEGYIRFENEGNAQKALDEAHPDFDGATGRLTLQVLFRLTSCLLRCPHFSRFLVGDLEHFALHLGHHKFRHRVPAAVEPEHCTSGWRERPHSRSIFRHCRVLVHRFFNFDGSSGLFGEAPDSTERTSGPISEDHSNIHTLQHDPSTRITYYRSRKRRGRRGWLGAVHQRRLAPRLHCHGQNDFCDLHRYLCHRDGLPACLLNKAYI